MSGFNYIQKLRSIEADLEELGMKLGPPQWYNSEIDRVAIYPDGDKLPIYSENCELFIGTLDECRPWIRGVHWARQYAQLLGIKEDAMRARREDRYRQALLIEKLRGSEPKT